MRAAVVVVVTRPVSVVVRLDEPVPFDAVDDVADVAAGVAAADAATAVDELDAEGLSGAESFCTCVAANADIDASEVSVTAVAAARRSSEERMRGLRSGIRL